MCEAHLVCVWLPLCEAPESWESAIENHYCTHYQDYDRQRKAKKEIRAGGHVLGGLHLREMECTGGLKTNKGLIISCINCWGQCTPAHLPSTSAVSPDVSSSTPVLWSLSHTSAWMVLIPARASWSHSCLCAVSQKERSVSVYFHLTLFGPVDLNTHKHTQRPFRTVQLHLYDRP